MRDLTPPHRPPARSAIRSACFLAAWSLLALVPSAATTTPVTPVPKSDRSRPKLYTVEQFMATRAMRGLAFTHDDRRLVYASDISGVFNLYSVPVDGGEPTPLTRSVTDNNEVVATFPTDDRILLTRDQGGNELHHLYLLRPDGSEQDLTPGDSLKAIFESWLPDGSAFHVLTNERDSRYFDVYRYDARTLTRTVVHRDTTGLHLGAIAPDGRWMAFDRANGSADRDILLRAPDGTMKLITPHEGTATCGTDTFSPDGRWLYFTTNDGTEFSRCSRYELESGKVEVVEAPEWDVLATSFSRRGRYRITTINADARTVLKLEETTTGRPVALPELPGGDITQIRVSHSEEQIAFYLNGDRAPNDLYVWRLGSKEARRLTRSLNPEIDPDDLVEAEVVRFKSFDGLMIPNILLRPHQATAEHRAPALVYVHGGPGGQTRRGYSALMQFLANQGYVVLGINNRGSSGYGKSFFTADDGRHGREPLWDCIAGRDYLAGLPWVDPARIGIMGGSYGGYMVLAALAFKPEEFRVGVNLFGVSNWVRTLESIPPYWEAQRRALYQEIGDPVTEREKLMETSPLFHADRIVRPLMVLQGANDPRVIKPESDDIVAAVKKNNVPVEYLLFPDEGHGFRKKKNQIAGYGAIATFLETYLKNAPTP